MFINDKRIEQRNQKYHRASWNEPTMEQVMLKEAINSLQCIGIDTFDHHDPKGPLTLFSVK